MKSNNGMTVAICCTSTLLTLLTAEFLALITGIKKPQAAVKGKNVVDSCSKHMSKTDTDGSQAKKDDSLKNDPGEIVSRESLEYHLDRLERSHIGHKLYGTLAAADVISCCMILIEKELRNHRLSSTEKKVARYLLLNHSNKSIGDKLFISLSTVKYHIRKIYKKTGCDNRRMFIRMIFSGVANSKHCWHDRRDLDRDIEQYQIR